MKKKFLAFVMALMLLFGLGMAVYAAPCDCCCCEPMATSGDPGYGGTEPPSRPPGGRSGF